MNLKLIVTIAFAITMRCFSSVYYLSDGEYSPNYIINNEDILIVDGGAAERITVNNNAELLILRTKPLNDNAHNEGGVMSILLNDYSTLFISGGATDKITLKKNSITYLSGGQINLIASQQVVTNKEHIIIDCKPNWLWKYNSYSEIKGIIGNWYDGTAFDINFSDQTNFGYNPVYQNVKVIPEPGAMALLSLGCVLINKRYRQ